MTLDRLTAVLAAAQPDITALEVAEALWLAGRVGRLARAADVATRPASAARLPAEDAPEPVTAAGPAAGPPAPARTPASARVPVHVPSAGAGEAAAATGYHVRTPDASALANPRAIQRAVRPLKRRVPKGPPVVIDEDASAQFIAESGTWLPVLRPAAGKWFELAFVVDTAASMGLWQSLVDDLASTLRQLGAFRDIRRWQLRPLDGGRSVGVAPHHESAARNAAAAVRRPNELLDPAGQRVFFVLTDATADMWWDGTGAGVLSMWAARCPVVVLQPLPERLWHRTGLRSRRGEFKAEQPGGATAGLHFAERRRRPRPLATGEVAVPVVEISPSWLASWSAMVTAASATATPLAATITAPYTPSTGRHRPERLVRETPARDARDLVDRFRATASPPAYRLATLLAAVPLELAVMRLVQRAAVPGSGPTHLAEVLLGGLIRTLPPAGPDVGAPQFDFAPGVRPALLDDARVSDVNEVLDRVAAYIASRAGGPGRTFRAVAATPAGDPVAVAGNPFAWIPPELLPLLGAPRPVPSATAAAAPDTDAQVRRLRERLGHLGPTIVDTAVEILAGLREAADRQSSDSSPVRVPRRYAVGVAPSDHTRLSPFATSMARALAQEMADYHAGRGWPSDGGVEVEIRRQETASPGTFRIETESGSEELQQVLAGTILQRFEHRVEGLVKGHGGAKVFNGVVHPVEMLNAMQREIEMHKAVLPDGRTLVPNRILIQLSPYDHNRLAPYVVPLAQELAESQAEFISKQGWAVYGDVLVEIVRGDRLGTGMFEVTAEVHTGPAVESGPANDVVRSFERRLDDLVGGRFTEVLEGVVSPVEILEAMQVQAQARTETLAGDRTLVANSFQIELAAYDYSRLAPYTNAIAQELAYAQAEYVGARGWTVYDDVVVEIARGRGLEPGMFRVNAWASDVPSPPQRSVRLVFSDGRVHSVPLGSMTVGRGPEANLRLADVGISRRHARLDFDGTNVVITDLGSTNGTLLNGDRISAMYLNDGDMIQLGSTTLRVAIGLYGAASP